MSGDYVFSRAMRQAAAAACMLLSGDPVLAQASSDIPVCRGRGGAEFTELTSRVQTMDIVLRAGTACRMALTGNRWSNPRVDTPSPSTQVEFQPNSFIIRANAGASGRERIALSWYSPAQGERLMVGIDLTITGPSAQAGTLSREAAAILQQVVPHWQSDFRNPRYGEVEFRFQLPLNANGTLGAPYRRQDPWDPSRVVRNFNQAEPEIQRLLESFVTAMKDAQPFRLPPGGRYRRVVSMNFRLGDL